MIITTMEALASAGASSPNPEDSIPMEFLLLLAFGLWILVVVLFIDPILDINDGWLRKRFERVFTALADFIQDKVDRVADWRASRKDI